MLTVNVEFGVHAQAPYRKIAHAYAEAIKEVLEDAGFDEGEFRLRMGQRLKGTIGNGSIVHIPRMPAAGDTWVRLHVAPRGRDTNFIARLYPPKGVELVVLARTMMVALGQTVGSAFHDEGDEPEQPTINIPKAVRTHKLQRARRKSMRSLRERRLNPIEYATSTFLQQMEEQYFLDEIILACITEDGLPNPELLSKICHEGMLDKEFAKAAREAFWYALCENGSAEDLADLAQRGLENARKRKSIDDFLDQTISRQLIIETFADKNLIVSLGGRIYFQTEIARSEDLQAYIEKTLELRADELEREHEKGHLNALTRNIEKTQADILELQAKLQKLREEKEQLEAKHLNREDLEKERERIKSILGNAFSSLLAKEEEE